MAAFPQRKNIRLKGYDYSRNGMYFITICTQNRKHYFGEIVGATLRGRPNFPHIIIEKWLMELENKFNDVTIGPYVIMPNHIHFIVQKDSGALVAENHATDDHTGLGDHIGSCSGDHAGSPLRDVVGWFKTMTTNQYIRGCKSGLYKSFYKRLWQRNYYEHIIRNERSYQRIVDYIQNNPAQWEQDSLNEKQCYV